jgi:uncharacterized delta-60 repeat protein
MNTLYLKGIPKPVFRFACSLLFLLPFTVAALAQSGPVDTSYAPSFKSFGSISNIIVQPDGKLLVNGFFRSVNGASRQGIVRLNADGTTDPTFQAPAGFQASKIALLADGKILYRSFGYGFSSQQPQLLRLNADGSPDVTFSVSSQEFYIYDLAVQSDGKILLAQQALNSNQSNRIIRLNPDGSVDAGFTPPPLSNGLFVLSLLSTGSKIIVSVYEPSNTFETPGRTTIRQFNGDGSPDPSFTIQELGPVGAYTSATLQADGKILLAGSFETVGSVSRSQLARLNVDGTVDTTFNFGTGVGDAIVGAIPLPNGKIIIAGTFTQVNGVPRPRLARLNADGSLDTSFDPGTGPNGYVGAITPRPDGSLLIGGTFSLFNGAACGGFAVVGSNGMPTSGVTATFGNPGSTQEVHLQPDGKALVTGFFNNVNGLNQVNLTRLNPDGSSDTTFNSAVTVLGFLTNLRLQPDGKILLWGQFDSINGSTGSMMNKLTRLNADGSLDTSFTAPPLKGFIEEAVVQTDGKIVIGGNFTEVGGVARTEIARLNADGSLDTSFNSDLQVDMGFGGIRYLAIQSSGKILVRGAIGNFVAGLFRLNTDGTTDPTFTPITTQTGFTSSPFFIRSDDRIVLVDGSTNRLLRLLPDGTPDPDFTATTLPALFYFIIEPTPGDGILIGGGFYTDLSSPVVQTPQIYLARFTSTGQRDTSLSVSFGITGDVRDAAVQNDGKILLAGPVQSVANTPVSSNLSLVRLNATLSDSCSFAVSPTSFNFSQAGGTGNLTVTAGTDCVWTTSATPDWVFFNPQPSAGTQTTQFFVRLNTGPARTATFTVAGQTVTITQAATGSGSAGAFRPSTGFVFLRNTNDTGVADTQFFYGQASDVPVGGDWDGDGTDTVGIYRDGTFFLRNSNSSGFADLQVPFGQPGDIPIAGDWNGDGIDTIGVVRGNQVFLRNSNTAGDADIQFNYGEAGDIFLAGDWDGDGIDTIGAYRPSNGFVYLRNFNFSGFADIEFFYGAAGDKPVVGDWNNDGVDTIGVVRGNRWLLRNSNTEGFAEIEFNYGLDTDIPIAGDWNGLP